MTDRIDPEETRKVWEGVQALWEKGMVAPTIYDHDYRGLDDVVLAMRDLESRKVWGKAVVTLKSNSKPRL
jgi:NADPH2:quinone reductase